MDLRHWPGWVLERHAGGVTTQMRLLHWLLRALSDHIMLPLFDRLGGTMDTTLGRRLCVPHTVVDETFAFHLVFDEAPPWAATASGDTG